MQEKEDKKGFLQSFTGKFKKISLDDEPDELMLKYGDIKLKGPGGVLFRFDSLPLSHKLIH